ncbi:hypothetical protein WICPIJ_004978 [Wickerhamomyces pijperi]|uniref:Copper-fist domain-containing protein n=1 Tax=Wickerhamomyces pijperi TaxID=599730 RepID=A0A9P8Q6U3_WICPI|nr:hypothetical protein WICPIJ_004978 [Wickerhamomyces pijperi]
MIYSDTIRMACLECLLGHKSKSCTHIRKIKNGRVYVIEDRGRHKSSPIISNYRSVPQAHCSAIRVVAGEEAFPTNDFCNRTMDSVYLCICPSCKKARRGRMSVFLDPSTLQLVNETSPSEELQSKFKKWKGMKVDCENKTVATNLPDSCHLMAIHGANYMDHIKIFESGAEIAGVIKQNLEKKDIYAGEKRPLDERSPYFSDLRFNPYYKKPIEISPDLDAELSQSVGDIPKEGYSIFEEPTLGLFHSQQPIGQSPASPGYDEVPYAAEPIAKDQSNEQLFRVEAYDRDLPRNTNFTSSLYNQGGWDPYLSQNLDIERNDDLIDPLLTSGGSHDHKASLIQDREVQMAPREILEFHNLMGLTLDFSVLPPTPIGSPMSESLIMQAAEQMFYYPQEIEGESDNDFPLENMKLSSEKLRNIGQMFEETIVWPNEEE